MLVSDLLRLIAHDYQINGRRSYESFVVYHWRHVDRLLGRLSISKLKPDPIEEFKLTRLEEGAARGSVNLQLGLLRRGLRLALRLGRVAKIPHVQMLSGQVVREGYLTAAQFSKIHATLEVLDADVADVCRWLYASGWRLGEALGLRWQEVSDEAITLPSKRSKNGRSRTVPLAATLRSVIEKRREDRRGPFVFHRRGRPIRSFRGTWRRACRVRGLDGVLIHDTRRSFARNCLLAGVPMRTAMAIGGWTSTRTFHRYAICDERCMAEALEKMANLASR